MFKAIKKFEINGNSYEVGDTVKEEDALDRLLRARKIVKFPDEIQEEVQEVQEANIQEPKKEKKNKIKEAKKEELKEEILTEESSSIEIKVTEGEEDDISAESIDV